MRFTIMSDGRPNLLLLYHQRAKQNPFSQSVAFALVSSAAEPPHVPSTDPYNPPRIPPFRYPAAANPRAAHLARLAQCMYPHRQSEGDGNPTQYNSGQHAYGGAYNATQHTQHTRPPMRPMSAPGIHPSTMASQQQYGYAVSQHGYPYDNHAYPGAPPSYGQWQPAPYTQAPPSISQQTSSLSHGSGGQRPTSLSMYATGAGSRTPQPASPHIPSPLSGATRARPSAADATGSSHLPRRPPVDLSKMNSSYRSIIAAVSQPDMGIVDPTLRHQRADTLQQAHRDAMHTLGNLDANRAHNHIRDRHNSVHGTATTSRTRTMSSGDLTRRLTKVDNPAGDQRKCLGCDATATPEWRRGPKGPGTLCNACGLVYAKLLKTRMNNAGHGSALADTDAAPSSSRRRLSGSGHTGSTGGEGSDDSDVSRMKSHKY